MILTLIEIIWFVGIVILNLVLLNILLGYSQNWSLLILTALYIPFEYFVED